jgi:hypothetical protein
MKVKETFGEHLSDGSLIEYIYDPELCRAMLARQTNGRILTSQALRYNDTEYHIALPNSTVRHGGVIFPSDIGSKETEQHLFQQVYQFLKAHIYFADDLMCRADDLMCRIAAYYAMYTWMFDCFDTATYLTLVGDAGSGKTEMLNRLDWWCTAGSSCRGATLRVSNTGLLTNTAAPV